MCLVLKTIRHKYVVAYFSSWFETPPKVWQRRREDELDIRHIDEDFIGNSNFSSEEVKSGSEYDNVRSPIFSLDNDVRFLFNNLRPKK